MLPYWNQWRIESGKKLSLIDRTVIYETKREDVFFSVFSPFILYLMEWHTIVLNEWMNKKWKNTKNDKWMTGMHFVFVCGNPVKIIIKKKLCVVDEWKFFNFFREF